VLCEDGMPSGLKIQAREVQLALAEPQNVDLRIDLLASAAVNVDAMLMITSGAWTASWQAAPTFAFTAWYRTTADSACRTPDVSEALWPAFRLPFVISTQG
jgi:hypothetical protein